jgi:hypothetical protein
MDKREYVFHIEFHGEKSAGLLPYYNKVTIITDYHPGDDDKGEYSFEQFLIEMLQEWFDGAEIFTDEEYAEILQRERDIAERIEEEEQEKRIWG